MSADNRIDNRWKKWKERKDREKAALEKQREEADSAFEAVQIEQEDSDDMISTDEEDMNFEVPASVNQQSKVGKNTSRKLRSSDNLHESNPILSNTTKFPEVLIRFSRKEFTPKVMRAVTHIQATYKLSSNDAMGVCVDIANMIFEQAWEKNQTSLRIRVLRKFILMSKMRVKPILKKNKFARRSEEYRKT